jgi:hypothetical protein
LVRDGIADLERGVESVPALLVSIGAPRLRRIGFAVPEPAIPSPELRLYERLAESDPDSAHDRYNALVRRLVSFESAAECAATALENRGTFTLGPEAEAELLASIEEADQGEVVSGEELLRELRRD